MLSRFRPRSAYDVIAALALFVALGGSAYAGANLPSNSVGTKQLKDGAVTSPKIADKTRAELHGARGARGPRGPRGLRGLQGTPGLSATGFSASADGTLFENDDFKLSAKNCDSDVPWVNIERKHDVAYDGSFIISARAPITGDFEPAKQTYGTGGFLNEGNPENTLMQAPADANGGALAAGTFTVDSGGHTYSVQVTAASANPGCTIRGTVVLGS